MGTGMGHRYAKHDLYPYPSTHTGHQTHADPYNHHPLKILKIKWLSQKRHSHVMIVQLLPCPPTLGNQGGTKIWKTTWGRFFSLRSCQPPLPNWVYQQLPCCHGFVNTLQIECINKSHGHWFGNNQHFDAHAKSTLTQQPLMHGHFPCCTLSKGPPINPKTV